MSQLEEFIVREKQLVCKLNIALCGLKQTPRAWFENFHTTFISLGFSFAKCDSSPFIQVTFDHSLYMLVYADDVITAGSSKSTIQALITTLNDTFSLKDLGKLHYFFEIEACRTSDWDLHLSQTKYITNLL